MKKILLIASTLFLGAVSMKAQSSLSVIDVNNGMTSVSDNAVIQYTTASNDHLTTEIDAQNISSTTKYYKLKRIDVSLNPGASAYFCVGGANCYAPTTTLSPLTMTLTPNQKLSDQNLGLLLDLEESSTPGFSSIKYEIINVNDANDVFTFWLNYNDDLTSVKESSNLFSSISNVFPNPAVNKASINVTASSVINNVSVTIINSLGSVVSNKNTHLIAGKNTINIETESLPSGIYFATVSSGNTKTVKKFTINK